MNVKEGRVINIKIKAVMFFFGIIMIVGFIHPIIQDLFKFDISGIVIGGLAFWSVSLWYEKQTQTHKQSSRRGVE